MSNTCFLQVLRNLSRELWPFKYNQQWPWGDWPASSVLMGKNLQGCTRTSICPTLPYLFECSLIWSFFPKGNSSFVQTFPTGFRDLELLKASLISKDQSKGQRLGTSSFSTSFITRCSAQFSSRNIFDLFLFFLQKYLQKLSCCHCIPYWIQIQKGFDISNPGPASL